ncbi:hypothetical protein CY35_09G068400 [Sphagnum magellanicum]|nr:hypothetical protein CY35_09G068400 [Sphagnum magellanicum]
MLLCLPRRSPVVVGNWACHICRLPKNSSSRCAPSSKRLLDVTRFTTRVCLKGAGRMEVLSTDTTLLLPNAKAPPVLLFDVMGTIVRDPFFEEIPAFFGLSMKELLVVKHPTAWMEFESGQVTEEELMKNFFLDGRDVDIEGLKDCMIRGYSYLEGVEPLLSRLQSAGFNMHAFSNYPSWYMMIEEKLKLSQYLPWTFVSCNMGLRKPDKRVYLEATRQLKVDPSHCIFIDDRSKNVEAAVEVGMVGIVFQDAKQVERELAGFGYVF